MLEEEGQDLTMKCGALRDMATLFPDLRTKAILPTLSLKLGGI